MNKTREDRGINLDSQAHRIYNTWMGDVQKLQLLSGVIRVIKEQDLLGNTRDVGFFLVDGLTQLEVRFLNLRLESSLQRILALLVSNAMTRVRARAGSAISGELLSENSLRA